MCSINKVDLYCIVLIKLWGLRNSEGPVSSSLLKFRFLKLNKLKLLYIFFFLNNHLILNEFGVRWKPFAVLLRERTHLHCYGWPGSDQTPEKSGQGREGVWSLWGFDCRKSSSSIWGHWGEGGGGELHRKKCRRRRTLERALVLSHKEHKVGQQIENNVEEFTMSWMGACCWGAGAH